MQDRYAGDIGDYVKLALLRAISPGLSLGIVWYLYPDEGHNTDGRHIGYLDQLKKWRDLDPELFDVLLSTVRDLTSVDALQTSGLSHGARFAAEPIVTGGLPARERSDARQAWFDRTMTALKGCELVFADPDNGLIDDSPHRRRDHKFGKQMPLAEPFVLSRTPGRPQHPLSRGA